MARKSTAAKQSPAEEAALSIARHMFDGPLQEQFARLASPASSAVQRRAAAEFTASLFVPLAVGLELDMFTVPECQQLTRGFWNALNASAVGSKAEGLNSILWEKALSGGYQQGESRFMIKELGRMAADPAVKKRGAAAKALASNINFYGLIWRPALWGNTPAGATARFNRMANRVKALLHPHSREALNLEKSQRELAAWRKHAQAALGS